MTYPDPTRPATEDLRHLPDHPGEAARYTACGVSALPSNANRTSFAAVSPDKRCPECAAIAIIREGF
jgi:hypothetical protein